LRLALRSSSYNIYYLQQTAKVYSEETVALKTIVSAYNSVKDKGYISASDIALVQAQLYSLQSEYQNLTDNINDQQSQLRSLLQVEPNKLIIPIVDSLIIKNNVSAYNLKALIDSAYLNRTDLRIARDNVTLSEQTYDYQKAMAVPDITLSAGMDRHGSYVTNFSALTIGFEIPLFNRNQGNIKNAKILMDYNKTIEEQTKKTLEEQIARGYEKALDAENLYNGIDGSFAGNFDMLANEMMKNYMKRNVSLLIFLNFYDAYKQNIVQLNTISNNKVNAMENLNYLTGTSLYNR